MLADVNLFETSNGNQGRRATDRTCRRVVLPGVYAEEKRQLRMIFSKDAQMSFLHLTPQRNACGRLPLLTKAICEPANSPHHDILIGDFCSTVYRDGEA
ncbi:hypothetical protein RB195_021004 [Necator americanus]|uniref:Uncharacterized protein n=1 Tax=Necator americanus TaxID=51031 RepID=A0ABR1CMH7_NECAM